MLASALDRALISRIRVPHHPSRGVVPQYALEAAGSGYVLETGRVVLANDSASLRNDPEVQKAYLGT